jgi:hypothetical protein
MTRPRRLVPSALAFAAGLLLASTAGIAGATPLDNAFTGQLSIDTPLHGTTVAARPELAGLIVADLDKPFTLGSLTGDVQSRVVREDGTGTLDFYWRVELDPSTASTGGIESLRLDDFGYAHLTDADWRIDGVGTVPAATARLFNPASYPEGAVNFLFGSPVTAGESSNFFFLHTNATEFAETADYDIVASNDTFTSAFDTFAPAVPEPAPAMLVALGLLTLGWLRSRRVPARD